MKKIKKRLKRPAGIAGDTAAGVDISLCMIVKNEEENIERALLSVRPVVHEMIVVDTGSTDRTKDIAAALGAKVYDFPWTDDFSAARNFSLSKASCSWILILDADEVISPPDHGALRKSVMDPKASAYRMMTRNYANDVYLEWNANDGSYPAEEKGIGWIPSSKIRLFVNDGRIRFEGPVHELVEPSAVRFGIEVLESPVPVHHYGLLNPERKEFKTGYYDLLVQKRFAGRNNDLMSLYHIAVSARALGRYREALGYWKKFIEIKPDSPAAFSEIAVVYALIGKYEDALQALKTALRLDPGSRDIVVMYAECELISGNAESAISRLENLMGNAPEFLPAVLGLAAACFCAGHRKKGADYLNKARDMSVNYNCAGYFCDLAKSLMSSGRTGYAISLLEAAVECDNISGETIILLNKCRSAAG